MPESNVEAVIAKHEGLGAAAADSTPDPSSAPPAGGSGVESASADEASRLAGATTSPEATIDHDELEAKLEADRARREAKEARRRAKQHETETAKTKAEAAAELAKWKALGKDESFLEAIKKAGHDPRVVYEQMKQEALKAGTPEAKIEQLERKHEAALEELRTELKKEREERAAEKAEREKREKEEADRRAATMHARRVEADFQDELKADEFKPLRGEYEDDQLRAVAHSLMAKPSALFAQAKLLKVPLTAKDGTFTMKDIFRVMRATQADHEAKKQRRNQSAEPQASEAPAGKGREANRTVNGTAERKADEPPTTLGNDIATSQAALKSEKELRESMTRDEWKAYVRKKHEAMKLE